MLSLGALRMHAAVALAYVHSLRKAAGGPVVEDTNVLGSAPRPASNVIQSIVELLAVLFPRNVPKSWLIGDTNGLRHRRRSAVE